MDKRRDTNMVKKWMAPILLTGAILFSITGIKTEQVYAKTEDTYIYQGISIDGIDIGGNTKEEAQKKLDEYIKELQASKVTFQTDLGSLTVSMKELGLSYSNDDMVEQAYSYGKIGNVIKRYKEQKDMEQNPVDLNVEKSIDTKKAKAVIQEAEDKLAQKAQNATLTRENGEFQIIAGKEGLAIDYKKSMQQLKSYVKEKWDGKDMSFSLQTTVEEPKYTSEDVAKVKDVLGTYTTNYSSSTSDRAQNVATGASHINGTVLYPGEEFSTYEKVAPYTYENGYRTGKSYLNGQVIDSIGGGVCQVSTTLYNAVIRAELEVTERYAHSMNVSYVPLAADAAMAGTYKNLKFKNNTDAPIYIEGSTYDRNITFTIYGQETRPSNRTIEFRSETLETYMPGADIETEDSSMMEGQSVVTQSAHIGYKAQLYKDVYVDGKKTESILMNTSTYQSSPRRVTVGTKKPVVEEPKEETTDTTEETQNEEKTSESESSTTESKQEESGTKQETTEAATETTEDSSTQE